MPKWCWGALAAASVASGFVVPVPQRASLPTRRVIHIGGGPLVAVIVPRRRWTPLLCTGAASEDDEDAEAAETALTTKKEEESTSEESTSSPSPMLTSKSSLVLTALGGAWRRARTHPALFALALVATCVSRGRGGGHQATLMTLGGSIGATLTNLLVNIVIIIAWQMTFGDKEARGRIKAEFRRNPLAFLLRAPSSCAFVGWLTNWVGVKMLFYPVEWAGVPLRPRRPLTDVGDLPPFGWIGWQGVVPSKAPQMARDLTRTVTGRLVSPAEALARLDATKVADRVDVLKIAQQAFPGVPAFFMGAAGVRDESAAQAIKTEARRFALGVAKDVRRYGHRALDVEGVCVRELSGRNVALLVDLFQQVGRVELKFLVDSGVVVGFFLGLLQAALTATLSPRYFGGAGEQGGVVVVVEQSASSCGGRGETGGEAVTISDDDSLSETISGISETSESETPQTRQKKRGTTPSALSARDVFELVGAGLVGAITNWLALLWIFQPVDPIKLGPVVVQGCFLRRQAEVSRDFAAFFVRRVLTARRLLADLLRDGPNAAEFAPHLRRRLAIFADAVARETRVSTWGPLGKLAAGLAANGDVLDFAAKRVTAVLPDALGDDLYDYADEALDLEATIGAKMAQLPARDFEAVLHPVFQKDEATLIAVGGVLGVAACYLQLKLPVWWRALARRWRHSSSTRRRRSLQNAASGETPSSGPGPGPGGGDR